MSQEFDPEIDDLLKDVTDLTTGPLWAISIAEDEIDKARERHGEEGRGRIWRSLTLLKPTHQKMSTEWVYRAHCRELLYRVAEGEDTRPGTRVEMLLGLSHVASIAPLKSDVSGLYLKLFAMAFPEQKRVVESIQDSIEAYERLYSHRWPDDLEFLRTQTAQKWRVHKDLNQ